MSRMGDIVDTWLAKAVSCSRGLPRLPPGSRYVRSRVGVWARVLRLGLPMRRVGIATKIG
jgi:hypothetical protein